jgi:formylglycine-generating enzyme required for sulfatase activity
MATASVLLPERHPLALGLPPEWASQWGQDEFGPWAAFSFDEQVQRLRWIPPGRFLMGSPRDEAGRRDNEGPQHEVTIAQGFWMFETPCTQALWVVVMGENPSEFRSPTRPVEQVSWDDCRSFVERLNARLEGLVLSLPSEAQWEYACRARTTTATYVGELYILGQYNAPVLDEIAWYGGNCGVEFELDNGWAAAGWPEKQYEFSRGGSHPVGLKKSNGWGLCDMLGNVWEWCADGYRSYGSAESEASAGRVLRGGSWSVIAGHVRAACRDWSAPGNRSDDVGFRCAEFRQGEPAGRGRAASASERVAEPRGDREPASPGAVPRKRAGKRSRG